MGNSGWISLHRKMFDNWVWETEEPFDCRSAWVDLILLANYEDKQFYHKGILRTVKEGQHWTSVRKLSERWHWSIHKTQNFLQCLEDDKMIERKSGSGGTLLTIVNYGKYQCVGYTERHTKRHTERHTDGHTERPQTINTNKTNKEIKEKASPFEGLDPEEMDDETYDRWQKWRAENGPL